MPIYGAESGAGIRVQAKTMHMDSASNQVTPGPCLELGCRRGHDNSARSSIDEPALQSAQSPSPSFSSHHHDHDPPPSQRFAHHILDIRPVSLSHKRSSSFAGSALNPLTSEPSLPPSLRATPDSPFARSVPLPSVDDVLCSQPCSPLRATHEPRGLEPSSSFALGAEPVVRNRLLDMVRDEFGDLNLDPSHDNASSTYNNPGLDLDGMSARVSRSNTVRSRASSSRGISPQPTIVLSLEHQDSEETLHEGHEGCTTCDETAEDDQQSFHPDGCPPGELREGQGNESEAQESLDGLSAARGGQLDVLSLAELREMTLPSSWPSVSLVMSEKLVIDRRVPTSSTAGPSDEEYGGLVPFDIPAFELGAAAFDPVPSSSVGSSLGSSLSSISKLTWDRKGSSDTAMTSMSSTILVETGVQPVFGCDFAARLICSLYRANLLKSPISSPIHSPSTSPSSGAATARWGGDLSVRTAAREVLAGIWDEACSESTCAAAHPPMEPDHTACGLGFTPGEDEQGQCIDLQDNSDGGSESATPIAAPGHQNMPTVTLTGFHLEGRHYEFDPAFSTVEVENLQRELAKLIARVPTTYDAESYFTPGSSGFSGTFALDGLAAEIGPLAPELATTRPSTPPETPTLGSQPLPLMTAPVTPMQTRPSSPNLLHRAVAINAALQQLSRGQSSRCPSPLSPFSASTTSENPSRSEDTKRRSLKTAGIASPTLGSGSPGGTNGRRRSMEWAKMAAPRSSADYVRETFGLGRDAVSVSQPTSPEFLKRQHAGAGGPTFELSTIASAPGSPRSSRKNTLSGLGLFLTRAGSGKQ